MTSNDSGEKHPVSRRDVLRSGAVIIAGSLLARFAGLGGSEAPMALDAKRIYIAADDHTDYMWTANEQTYRLAFLEMIDYYLDLADATATHTPDFQSRWNCDGSFWMWTYERNRTPAQFERFIAQLRSRHLSVPLTALVLCLGGAPAEAVLRGMYYPGQIERRYNLRFPLAVCMENQTLSYGLGALWAGAGAQFSWRGVCGCATRVPLPGDREHDIYWWEGADGSRVLMKWNSQLTGTNEAMGGYAEARNPAAVVEYVDTNADFRTRYPYDVIGAFGKGWDDLKTLTDEFVTVAQSKSTSSRRVIVSDERDFFEDFQTTYGAQLPSLACSFGNEWDLYCASLAEVSATVKRALEKLRAAEALATLVCRYAPTFMDSRRQARDECWMALGLYWEHNWTADGPISRADRAAWQRRLAAQITGYVDMLYDDATVALSGQIATTGANPRFFVFNPLGWERSDSADLPYVASEPAHVVDVATGEEVPSQAVVVGGQQRLRVLAERVPSVGYKVFEVRPGVGQAFAPAATVEGATVEHALYRLTMAANGAITSLIDKRQANREFVRTIDGRTVNDLGAGAGALQLESSGPVSLTLLATVEAPLAHTTRVTLTRGSDRIAIENIITQNFSDVTTWSFAFNLDKPDVWHEEVGAVIRANLLAQGGHYAHRNARYDWLTLNHFADMSAGSVGITLSNADCYFMQLGNSAATTLDTATARIAPLVGGQVDGPNLGIPNQGGDTRFTQRFALQSHGAFDAPTAMRFALEHQNPLVAHPITGGSAYPPDTFSLLALSNPDVLLWALKPADDGADHGVIARVWNLAATSASCTIAAPTAAIATAQRVSHIETPLSDAPTSDGRLSIGLAAHQLQTYALAFGATPTPTVTPSQTATPTSTSVAPTVLTATPAGCGANATPTQTTTATPDNPALPTPASAAPKEQVYLPLVCQRS